MKELTIIIAFIVCFPCFAQANICTVSSSGISFTYLTDQSTPTDITGTVTTSCDNGATQQVIFSTGSGTYANRVMTSAGGGTLNYQIYANGAHTVIYGDTTGGTSGKNAVGSTSFNLYGRIPARQNAIPGTYSDTVIATITF